MTVNEYLKSLETDYPAGLVNRRGEPIADIMKDVTHIWTNDAASGYTVQAMKDAGFSEVDIWKVQRALIRVYDELTISEAEAAFHAWNNDFSTVLE